MLNSLTFKDGVTLIGLQPEALVGIWGCIEVFNSYNLTMTLTSCRDGVHSDHSHHYKGLAWDIRIWSIQEYVETVCDKIHKKLGPDYQVISEKDHIHVEYDPKEM